VYINCCPLNEQANIEQLQQKIEEHYSEENSVFGERLKKSLLLNGKELGRPSNAERNAVSQRMVQISFNVTLQYSVNFTQYPEPLRIRVVVELHTNKMQTTQIVFSFLENGTLRSLVIV
jgi:hypothetical protein